MPAPQNINQLITELSEAYDSVKRDPRRANQVKEMANTAGKIIQACAVTIEYAHMRRERPELPFMAGSTSLPSVRQLPEAGQ